MVCRQLRRDWSSKGTESLGQLSLLRMMMAKSVWCHEKARKTSEGYSNPCYHSALLPVKLMQFERWSCWPSSMPSQPSYLLDYTSWHTSPWKDFRQTSWSSFSVQALCRADLQPNLACEAERHISTNRSAFEAPLTPFDFSQGFLSSESK